MLLILFFILLLNVTAILLTYHSLTDMDKKERIIFVGVGVAIMYILTSIVYWLSTKGIDVKEVSETGKNIITFLFVPINSIITLPIIAKSYCKYKDGKLTVSQFRNRIIVMSLLLIAILVIERSYFKDIQNGVINLTQNAAQNQVIDNNTENTKMENDIENQIGENEITNQIIENDVVNIVNE